MSSDDNAGVEDDVPAAPPTRSVSIGTRRTAAIVLALALMLVIVLAAEAVFLRYGNSRSVPSMTLFAVAVIGFSQIGVAVIWVSLRPNNWLIAMPVIVAAAAVCALPFLRLDFGGGIETAFFCGFVIQGLIIAPPLLFIGRSYEFARNADVREVAARRGGTQFHLAHLILVTALLAGTLAVLQLFDWRRLWDSAGISILVGAAFGISGLLAAWGGLSNLQWMRPMAWYLVAVSIVLSIAFPLAIVFGLFGGHVALMLLALQLFRMAGYRLVQRRPVV